MSHVDLYPTLADVCGLALPEHLEGTSFAPLLDQPQRPWKTAAFSQYVRGGAMGHSIRTDRYRLNRWTRLGRPNQVVAVELYDHQTDPGENVNLSEEPAYAAVIDQLELKIRQGWRKAVPPGS